MKHYGELTECEECDGIGETDDGLCPRCFGAGFRAINLNECDGCNGPEIDAYDGPMPNDGGCNE